MGQVKVKQIAKIAMGLSFRKRLEPSANGNVFAIQMKDLPISGGLDARDLVRIDSALVHEGHRLKPGDLIFRSRGQINTAVLVDKSIGPAVSVAPLMRIRLEGERVLPGYLCWYINLPRVQARLAGLAKGTAIQLISKQALENFEVELPSLEDQHRIVELATLAEHEQRLLAAIADKRGQYIERILMQFTSESRGDQ